MKLFDKTINEALNFSDMFGDEWDKIISRKVIRKDPPKTRGIILDLYRGFDADIESLERTSTGYILSPEKSEQESIWFSQWLRDAQGRGEWILKYPLKAIQHYERAYYDDGTHYDGIPDNIRELEEPTQDSKIYGGIELPQGWFWSYKVQKYIIAKIPIEITKDMVHRDSDYEEEL